MSGGKAYVILVNWQGWADTVECLESLLRSDHERFQVVVCDNASPDGSLEKLKAWAEGHLEAAPGAWPRLTTPPVAKPVPHRVLDRAQAEAGTWSEADRLVLVATGANLGFAGGNNVALRGALARGDFAHAWLLNNDTVVAPDALRQLVQRLDEAPGAGLCGSTLYDYDEPHAVQAYGGSRYSRWLAMPRRLRPPHSGRREEVERDMAYVVGASLLASRAFLESVGLMCEDYFLFFEELDWALRAKGRFRLAWAPASIVYHKEGRSTGLSGRHYSAAAERRLLWSQLRLTRRHLPGFLPLVVVRHLLVLLKSLLTLHLERAGAVLRLYRDLALHGGAWPPG